jgi:hypothetical protein
MRHFGRALALCAALVGSAHADTAWRIWCDGSPRTGVFDNSQTCWTNAYGVQQLGTACRDPKARRLLVEGVCDGFPANRSCTCQPERIP